MSTFVLIHGAGDVGWYWHLVEAELRERGHEAVVPDLPCDDELLELALVPAGDDDPVIRRESTGEREPDPGAASRDQGPAIGGQHRAHPLFARPPVRAVGPARARR